MCAPLSLHLFIYLFVNSLSGDILMTLLKPVLVQNDCTTTFLQTKDLSIKIDNNFVVQYTVGQIVVT